MSEQVGGIESYLDDGELTYRGWARALEDEVLLGQHCTDCSHATAAPKAACARCGGRDLAAVQLPTEGEVYAETTIGVPPAGFDDSYQVALVSLGDARVLARIDGEVTIGDRVTLQDVIESDGRPAPVFG